MPSSDAAAALRVEPVVLGDAAPRFGAMSATVREAQAQLATAVAGCLPLLGGPVRDAAEASGRAAGEALGTLADNYAVLGQAMADLATRYRGVHEAAVRR
jgi:hypothetical protein